MRQLADTPLMLNIITLAYNGMQVEPLQAAKTVEHRRTQLFGAYVQRMFERRNAAAPISNIRLSTGWPGSPLRCSGSIKRSS